jgi:uncharacterized repeat protein (TIGR01451 family)
VVNGDNITAAYSTTATIGSPVGTYPITASLVDTNNRQANYTVAITNGTLTVFPSADIAVTVTGSNTVTAGSTLTYTVTITNLGPSTSSNVVATDSLPTNATFANLTGGGTNNSGVVTWNLGNLANGQTTNVTVTVTAPASGSLTNTASATASTSDPNPANNNGSSAASQVVTAVVPVQFGILAGTIALNPQTGLYEEQVVVTNTGLGTVLGVRLYVDGLRTNVTLYTLTRN